MKKKVVFKPTDDYEKIHEASIEAINLMEGTFTRVNLKRAINDLLTEDKLTITAKLLETRITEQVDVGAIVLISKGAGKRPHKYKRVRNVERIGLTYNYTQAPELPAIDSTTPKQICEWLLDYMQTTIGVKESINDLDTVRKDAATMHELQERCSQLVERHNSDQREISKLMRSNQSMHTTCKQYRALAKEHDALVRKLTIIKEQL